MATSHGKYGTPEYRSWESMIRRCYYKGSRVYKWYGGRGITVCDRWRGPDGFANFLADMDKKPSLKHGIDRFPDKNGNYCPENCRWATQAEQMRNTNRNRNLTFNGRTMCLTDWASEMGVEFLCLWERLDRGWSVEKTLTTPIIKPGDNAPQYDIDGESLTLKEWEKKTGIKPGTAIKRMTKGWSPKDAILTPLLKAGTR